MDEALLRQLSQEYLLPLFSGAELLPESLRSDTGDLHTARTGHSTIAFKVNDADSYRLVMKRSQPFSKQAGGHVTAPDVTSAFVRVLQEIQGGLSTSYKADLLATFQRRVVVKAVAPAELQETLLDVLDQLALWATRLYEGRPIAGAVGFVSHSSPGTVSFREICREDFGSILSNGFDTLLRCSFSGDFLGLEALYPPARAPSFAPHRQASIADWSKDGKVAVALNDIGEILVFRNGELLFTRRSGMWRFLTHESFLTQMGCPQDKGVRRAIYESCLDASFSRIGACLGVVSSRHISEWKLFAPSIHDHMDAQASTKSKAIAVMLDGKPFQDLDRRIRQELMAIDGATLLDHHGRVLAVGAILRIEGGSKGGGRLAAAQESGKLGLGITVSQDGGILGFRDAKNTPEFSIMA